MGAPQYEQAGADVSGSGTPGTIPVWSSGTTLTDSILKQSSTNVLFVGGTAQTWQAFSRVLQLGATSTSSFSDLNSDTHVTNNGVFNGFWTRVNAAPAANYYQSGNTHVWRYAATGAAGSAITWSTLMASDASGNVGIGTASPASRLDVAGTITCDDAGTGLKLPATPGNTDPNTLDAYRDGGTAGSGGVNWAASLVDNSGAGLALTVTSAQYIQIGKLIVIQVDVTYPVTASAAIAKLSLPVAGATVWQAGALMYQNPGTNGNIADLAPGVNGSDINFWSANVNRTNAALSDKRLIFSISYFAA